MLHPFIHNMFNVCVCYIVSKMYITTHTCTHACTHTHTRTHTRRIDEAGVIKVADFGLSQSIYEQLYFRQDKSDSVKLPIKWLAIECMEDGVFSEKSDVVSTWPYYNYTTWHGILLAAPKGSST